jgi:predicted enzyme related to lactoylglutathione lyase
MSTRDTNWPEGTPNWVDLGVSDINQARAFYAALFGWTIPEGTPETGGYTVATLKGHNVAGIGPKQGPSEAPSMWMTYLASDDADATVARIKGAGGQLIMDPMDVMDFGRMAVALDASGVPFGLWQGRLHTGAAIVNEPGAQTWNEHLSRDFEGAKAFYQAVFGYEYEDASGDGFKYAAFKLNDKYAGGIGEYPAGVPDDVPAAWGAYFGTSDTDATVAKVVAQGGSTIREPQDSPYGRTATVTDDQGAVFSLLGITES